MATNSLPITNFYTADGNPVVNGYITIRLNMDGTSTDEAVNSKFTRISLDANGALVGNPQFVTNASISPTGTYYIVNVYKANGQLIGGPLIMFVSNGVIG